MINESNELVEVFSTLNPIESGFIESLLSSNGIDYFVHNRHGPMGDFLVIPLKILVPKSQEKAAKEIIEQYYNDLKESE